MLLKINKNYSFYYNVIKYLIEDENLRANSVPKTMASEATTTSRSITNNNANMSAIIRPQSTPNSDTTSNERATKKTRTTSSCDVKVVTRINLPMTATATAAKANLLKSSPIQNTNLNLLDNRSVIHHHHHPKNNNNITRILQLKKLANPHDTPQQQQLEQQQKNNHHNHRIYMDLKPSSITTTIKKVEVVLNRSQTQQQPK